MKFKLSLILLAFKLSNFCIWSDIWWNWGTFYRHTFWGCQNTIASSTWTKTTKSKSIFQPVKIDLLVFRTRWRGEESGKTRRSESLVECMDLQMIQISLLQGGTPTILRNGINQAFNFMTYDLIKRLLWGSKDGQLNVYQSLSTGMNNFYQTILKTW